MTDTSTVIAQLSSDAVAPVPMRSPIYWGMRLLAVLVVYGLGSQAYLGVRIDLLTQFSRPLFAAEIALLVALLLSSGTASVLAMYPDAYQKQKLLVLPYAIFIVLVGLVLLQFDMPVDARMVIPPPGGHAMECALCIGAIAILPSALAFAILRKGATIRPLQAGSFAVLMASAMGGLSLRLAESNDSMLHLASWHYLPTLLFASIGALLGKLLLRW
ncbi:MAG: hypothetical protein B7X02_00515 [Rhodospirillales bacterium 12-54-5]|nr:MAG: hypothetical protein B7X02_00515 [Rhodospirillales bacterium 12-54-5]